MKTPDKVATVVFWGIASALAVVAVGDAFWVGLTRDRPELFLGGILVCIVASLGVRECANALRRRNESHNAV